MAGHAGPLPAGAMQADLLPVDRVPARSRDAEQHPEESGPGGGNRDRREGEVHRSAENGGRRLGGRSGGMLSVYGVWAGAIVRALDAPLVELTVERSLAAGAQTALEELEADFAQL